MKIRCVLVALAALFLGTQAHGAFIVINTEGYLVGAQNVQVGGSLYDVTFASGTCAEIFHGCDERTDFLFHDRTTAELAGAALLDQVFVDIGGSLLFDQLPGLTDVCKHDTRGLGARCDVFTPWVFDQEVTYIDDFGSTTVIETSYRAVLTTNTGSDHIDSDAAWWYVPIHLNWDPTFNATWAVWSPVEVPAPGSFGLLAMGLLLGFSLRRRR
jgi:hypothetical protein